MDDSVNNSSTSKQLAAPKSLSYVVSLQKPTAVTAAVIGNFRNKENLDLIIARLNRLEYFLVTAEGLQPYHEIPIFGRISALNLVRLPGETLDSIVVLTLKYHLAILGFDEKGNVKTRAFGNVSERVGRPSECGNIVCTHGPSGIIAIKMYEGQLKILQWEEGQELKAHNFKMEEFSITDMVFMENTEEPTLSFLYHDAHGRHLKTCVVDMEEKEIKALWKQPNLEAEATLLIPVPRPYRGLIVVGKESISYFEKNIRNYISISPPPMHSSFTCFGRVDKTGERFLLGDSNGQLFVLLLIPSRDDQPTIKDIKIELLGETTIPCCIVYLDNSVAFVGSHYGDSQLIKLSTQPVNAETNSFISIMDVFPSIGPVRDIDIMAYNGQDQLITASGAFKEGSMKIVRSGIGIEELATIELSNVKSLFTLKFNSDLDNYMVVSFSDVSHLFLVDNEEMEDCQMPDFDLSEPMIWAGNVYAENSPTRILQITPSFVQLISGDGTFKTRWTPPIDDRLSLASVNCRSSQIAVTSGSDLFYLRVDLDEIHLVGQIKCREEIACVDISPLEKNALSKFIVTGFWRDHSVSVFSISDTIEKLTEEKTGSEFLPRSILQISMEETEYLFMAMGDGAIYYYELDPHTGGLKNQKKITLGTRPVLLRKFLHKGVENVFVCSDRPTVIYSSNHKLMFSNVNLKLVTQMCSLNSAFYRNCFVLSDDENVIIGTIDDIQKIHIRSIPLGESVSRIAYQSETNTIGLLTCRLENERPTRTSISTIGPKANTSGESSGGGGGSDEAASRLNRVPEICEVAELEAHSFCLMDASTFECLSVFQLNRREVGLSLASVHLGVDPNPYFAIGAALENDLEQECKQGRIIILQVTETISESKKVRMVCEKEVKGAVYSITDLRGKLICSVNITVSLFDWTPERELRLECFSSDFTTAYYIKTKGDLILVGDMMRSMTLLSYKQVESSLEEITRDYSTQWTTACEIIDSDTFLGAENSYNLYCCVKESSAADSEEDTRRMKDAGAYYLGEMVNVFKRGTLVSLLDDVPRQIPFTNPILYGTAEGGLGAIVQLPPEYYAFCEELQKRIASKIHNCLRVEHSTYRAYSSDKRIEKQSGFIDGDLIESLLEMPKETVATIVSGMKIPKQDENTSNGPSTVEEILKVIEDLSQTH